MGEQRDAVIARLGEQAEQIRQAQVARDQLVALLDLYDMAHGQPATWQDIVDYTAKALGTRTLLHDTIRRRQRDLAMALQRTGDPTWPELLVRVRELIERERLR